LVEKPEGKSRFGRLKPRWEDDIRVELKERGWEYVDFMHVNQDRDQWRALVDTVPNLRFPLKGWKFLN
jgi:hypothetical protein